MADNRLGTRPEVHDDTRLSAAQSCDSQSARKYIIHWLQSIDGNLAHITDTAVTVEACRAGALAGCTVKRCSQLENMASTLRLKRSHACGSRLFQLAGMHDKTC